MDGRGQMLGAKVDNRGLFVDVVAVLVVVLMGLLVVEDAKATNISR